MTHYNQMKFMMIRDMGHRNGIVNKQ